MRNIVLIGFMGAGKTQTAAALARRVGFAAVDTDSLIEQEQGRTIPDIFRSDGEATFRHVEADVVARVAKGTGQVIACGGGAILAVKNLTALQDAGPIVYLRARPETLIERLGAGADRPLLRGNPAKAVPELLKQRESAYRSAADLIVETDDRTPEEVAEVILAALTEARR